MIVPRVAFRRFILFALVCAAGAGCGQKSDSAPAAAAAPKVALDQAQHGAPLSDADCLLFAQSIERAVAKGDTATVNKGIDWDGLLNIVTSGIPGADATRRGFAKGVKSASEKENGFASVLVKAVAQGGSYNLLRVHRKDGRPLALFRLHLPHMGGVNYHDLALVRSLDGQVRMVDWYIFLAGEEMTQILRRGFIEAAAHDSRGLIERLQGKDNAYIKNLDKIKQMIADMRAGRPQAVMDAFHKLPPEMQIDRTVLIVRLQAAQALGDKEYAAAIADFEKHCSDEAAVYLLSIDGYTLRKQYDHVLESIDRLDTLLGGDPYLDFLRATTRIQMGQWDEARKSAASAIEREPTLIDGYWAAVTISLHEKNFDETLSLFEKLEQKFHMKFADLTTVPEYAEFAKSPQYEQWLATHPVTGPAKPPE